MRASLVFVGLCALVLVWGVAESDAQSEQDMKKVQKIMSCMQGTDVKVKMERIKKGAMACKDKSSDYQAMAQCMKKEMSITPEEEKCIMGMMS